MLEINDLSTGDAGPSQGASPAGADELGSVVTTTQNVPPHSAAILPLLLQAYEYAGLSCCNLWDFALELSDLRVQGLTVNDLRWLVYCGYVEHAEEIPSENGRAFQEQARAKFSPKSCFVLTDKGADAARCFRHDGETVLSTVLSHHGHAVEAPHSGAATPALLRGGNRHFSLLPAWDLERRELRLAGVLVKRFKVRSENQERVLNSFEEEGWPVRVDDPLPTVSALNRKRRLHDTIKSLNRHQKNRCIRFMGDGRGEGVLWEPCISPLANACTFNPHERVDINA